MCMKKPSQTGLKTTHKTWFSIRKKLLDPRQPNRVNKDLESKPMVINIQAKNGDGEKEDSEAQFKSFGDDEHKSAGPIKEEDKKLLEDTVIDFNKVGMQFLSSGKIEEAKLILRKLVRI